jgi:hypothetical protein
MDATRRARGTTARRSGAGARVEAGLPALGRGVNDADVPEWWTLADSTGNEVNVAPDRTSAELTHGAAFSEVRRSGAWVSQSEGEWRPHAC